MKQNNKWRRRIIRVLESLMKDLQSRSPGPTQSEVINKLAAKSGRADSIMNGLDNFEVADALYYTRSITMPKMDDSVLYKLKDCLEDTAFAVYCSMQDATYFRLFSARAWREFALGSIGVQTATLCTNSALAQLGRMSEQLRRTLDHFNDDAWMIRMHTKIDTFMGRYIANDMKCTDTHPDSIDPAFEDVSLARHAARKLGFYASTLQCSRLSTLLFEAFFAQQRLHPADTMEETRLLKSLAQLRCLEWSNDPILLTFKTDSMYDAARSLLLGHMDTDAVFAAQMLYDIQQEVDPRNFPLEDILEASSLDYLQLYDKYDAEWMNENRGGNRSARVKRMHNQHNLLRHIVYSDSDVQVNLERWEHATPRQHTIRRFNIVRHVPLLMGQMLFHYHKEFDETFLDVANDRGHILTAIHLYNAAKKSGSLPPEVRWDDMEWVIDSQVGLYLFGGSPADTGPKYLKDFCDAYGLKHSKFSIGHKLANPEQVKSDIHRTGRFPRRLESGSNYVRACSEIRRLPLSKPFEWRLRMMQAFADYRLDPSSAYGSPHSIGILIAAKEACEGDEEALGFDIFAFHITCAKLLSRIRRACFEYAPDDYPGIRYDGADGLNTTVAELLRDLLNCPRHHDRMWPLVMRLLVDVIKQEGSACEDMAFERMKMATLDSIRMDSDDTKSDTSSAGSARTGIETPPPEFMEVDEHERDIEISKTSRPRSREDGEEPHVPSKRLKFDSAGPSPSADPKHSEELERQQQLAITDFMNLRVERTLNGSHLLVSQNGTVLSSWSP